eukprot:1986091-Rhodomonas_salina.3
MASKNLSTRCLSRQSDTSAAFSTADVGSTSAPFPRRSCPPAARVSAGQSRACEKEGVEGVSVRERVGVGVRGTWSRATH